MILYADFLFFVLKTREVGTIDLKSDTVSVDFTSRNRNRLPRRLRTFLDARPGLHWYSDAHVDGVDLVYTHMDNQVTSAVLLLDNAVLGIFWPLEEQHKQHMHILLSALEAYLRSRRYTRCFVLAKKRGEMALEQIGYEPVLWHVPTGVSLMVKQWHSNTYGPIEIEAYNLCLPQASLIFIHLETWENDGLGQLAPLEMLNRSQEFIHVVGLRGSLSESSLQSKTKALRKALGKIPNHFLHLSDITLSARSWYLQTPASIWDTSPAMRAAVDIKLLNAGFIKPLKIGKVYLLDMGQSEDMAIYWETFQGLMTLNQVNTEWLLDTRKQLMGEVNEYQECISGHTRIE